MHIEKPLNTCGYISRNLYTHVDTPRETSTHMWKHIYELTCIYEDTHRENFTHNGHILRNIYTRWYISIIDTHVVTYRDSWFIYGLHYSLYKYMRTQSVWCISIQILLHYAWHIKSMESWRFGGRLNTKMSSYQNKDPHLTADKAVSPIMGKTVFTMRRALFPLYIIPEDWRNLRWYAIYAKPCRQWQFGYSFMTVPINFYSSY